MTEPYPIPKDDPRYLPPAGSTATHWAVGQNDPGYLPDNPPTVHATADEAKQVLADALHAEAEAAAQIAYDSAMAEWDDANGVSFTFLGMAWFVTPTDEPTDDEAEAEAAREAARPWSAAQRQQAHRGVM